MFRRFISIWLMLSTLGYGVVAAADMHYDAADHIDNHVHAIFDVDAQPDQTDQMIDGDHCCHGAAHLIGLTSRSIPMLNTHIKLPVVRRSQQLHPIGQTPDLRPPKAA